VTGSGIVVFLGPSLSAQEARALLPDATILPPARQGDIYRATRDYHPRAIALIDGTFATVPAVWHREILWAMAERGVRIYGAASMGALRAAELDTYGMVGVGKIYESYRIGCYAPFTDPFEDDDEVAVRHGPPETVFIPISHAMVDVRETLAAAETAGLIGYGVRDQLVAALKQLHFPERNFARLAQAAAALPKAKGAALATWLRAGHAVSQKRRDAEALLRQLAGGVEKKASPAFVFERAQVWERFRAAADAAEAGLPSRAAAEKP
jgi:hypothetical protein